MSDSFLGKPTNMVGIPSKELILKGTALKFQWGNKFIEIIKNGKINSDKILKTASNEDSVNTDGIYITDDNKLVVCVDGTKLSLGEAVTSYISYLEEQPDLTPDQKQIALLNSGFYYKTLEEAKNAKINSGVIFNLEDNTFYLAKEGELTKFQFIQETKEQITTTEQDLNIHEIKSNNKLFIQFLDNIINCKVPIKVGETEIKDRYIKTVQLECEQLIMPSKTSYSINSTQDNTISYTEEIEDSGNIKCVLQDENLFKENDKIFIINDPITLNLVTEETNKYFKLSDYANTDITIFYTVEEEQKEVIIPVGQLSSTLITDEVLDFSSTLINKPNIIEGTVISSEAQAIIITANTVFKEFQNKKISGSGSSILPPKTIMIYYGETAPYGWQFCNGTNGTPNIPQILENVNYIMKL